MADTKIDYVDKVWNPLRGCSPVSAGCAHCYAAVMASRFSGEGMPYEGLAKGGKWTGKIRLVPEKLGELAHWKKPARIFVNSMSDLFHKDVPGDFIDSVFGVMALCQQHTFLVLTKRAERMQRWVSTGSGLETRAGIVADAAAQIGKIVWDARGSDYWLYERATAEQVANRRKWVGWPLPNVWLGVSVTNQETADERIPLLLQTPAAVRWVSAEPLLGPVHLMPYVTHFRPANLGLPRLSWVVAGCESGPKARPCNWLWLKDIKDDCVAAGVPVWIKQAMFGRALIHAPEIDGQQWQQWQQLPEVQS